MVSVFTVTMLALGVGLLTLALVYIVGMVLSIAAGVILAPLRHH